MSKRKLADIIVELCFGQRARSLEDGWEDGSF